MSWTQWPQVIHKAILREIQTQLLILATEFWTKHYWVAGPSGKSLYYLRRQTRWLDWCHRCFWCLWWRWSWKIRRQGTHRLAGLCSESAGLALTDSSQFPLQFTVEWLKLLPWITVTVLEPGVPEPVFPLGILLHPVASTWSQRLTIYGNLLPHIW